MGEPSEKDLSRIFYIFLYVIIAAVVGVFTVRYIIPVILPFILAFLTALFAQPTVELLEKRTKMGRKLSSFLCMLVFLLSILGILAFIVTRLYDKIAGALNRLPDILDSMSDFIFKVSRSSEKFIVTLPEDFRDYIYSATESAENSLASLPGKLSQTLIGKMSVIMGKTSEILLFIAMYIIGSFFISLTFSDIKFFLIRQIPPRLRSFCRRLKGDMLDGLGTWLKAQLTLMAVTFFELSLGLSLLKIKSPILIAALTAIIDSLPVLGTGIVLIPWAIISLILGSKIKALGLICLYIIVTAVHSVLEPKLVSVGFGVNPAATLLFSYLGLKLCGAVGMVIFPLILMMVKTLNDKGYIHLWR